MKTDAHAGLAVPRRQDAAQRRARVCAHTPSRRPWAACRSGSSFHRRSRRERSVGGRTERPTCAWFDPEPLCRRETTILTRAAAEEPSSTDGGAPTTDEGGKRPSVERRRDKYGQKRHKGAFCAGSTGEPFQRPDSGARQWARESRPAGRVFVSQRKAALPGRWRVGPFAPFVHGGRINARLTGTRDPAFAARPPLRGCSPRPRCFRAFPRSEPKEASR